MDENKENNISEPTNNVEKNSIGPAIEPIEASQPTVEPVKAEPEKVQPVSNPEPARVEPVVTPNPGPERVETTNTQNQTTARVQPQYKQQPKQQPDGLNVAALILGIISLVLWCFWFISVPCAILAFIFGIVGMKKNGRGMAISGIVTGAISIVIWALLLFFVFVFAMVDEIGSSSTYTRPSSYYEDFWEDYFDL